MPCLMVEYAHVMSAGPGATLIPILLLFFLSQKYFFHGIEDGGLRF
jgi:ABC-type glycerol-3-phosphate transport system permease component